ncbi:hypothetical protein [Amycolatopsis plumensis]|uniref:hypothetical protein n=1 Tax=Amycolatopsis plumensis TaxID=236508 RepID=UPI00361CA78D
MSQSGEESATEAGSGVGDAAHIDSMTTDTLTKPISKLAEQLNAHLETQTTERALTLIDRCDRCSQLAQSSFVFTIPADLTARERPRRTFCCVDTTHASTCLRCSQSLLCRTG